MFPVLSLKQPVASMQFASGSINLSFGRCFPCWLWIGQRSCVYFRHSRRKCSTVSLRCLQARHCGFLTLLNLCRYWLSGIWPTCTVVGTCSLLLFWIDFCSWWALGISVSRMLACLQMVSDGVWEIETMLLFIGVSTSHCELDALLTGYAWVVSWGRKGGHLVLRVPLLPLILLPCLPSHYLLCLHVLLTI